MAEMTQHEDVGLLAFSPLACGMITGKYAKDAAPASGTRRSITDNLGGRTTDRVWPAIDAYLDIAAKYNMDLCILPWRLHITAFHDFCYIWRNKCRSAEGYSGRQEHHP